METPFDTRHLLSHRQGLVSEVASDLTRLPTERVMDLLNLGAFYVNGERVLEDRPIEPGCYLRLHLKPKRYDVGLIDWAKVAVFENDHMIVIDKPGGYPVHAMVDNIIENVVEQLARARGLKLYVTQRLDIGTQGLMVVAKTREFLRGYNELLREKKVSKAYSAILEKELPLGRHRHFIAATKGSPKIVSEKPLIDGNKWFECLLEIRKCEPTQNETGKFFEAEIDLITGRTHQIRAQCGFMGAPLVGDKLYGSRVERDFVLISKELKFSCPLSGQHFTFQRSDA